ncbi:MAG: glycoside hydrolase family 65 protein [Candidatus Omnitrophica bacterium]|nr:glycoside hydrolase family 65 protein [Candidatus Omnitrophota bacterium]
MIKDKFEDIISKESWIIRETSWDRNLQNVRETQFTLGNGYLCSRGVLEEIPYDAQPGTFISGLYDEAGSQVTEIVNLPNPINFKLIAQGEKIDAVAMDIVSHNRALDMQKGVLFRHTLYQNAKKERFDYQSFRFFSMSDPHIGVMRIHFTPVDADADIIVETFLDTSTTNRGILSEGKKRHFEVTKFSQTKKVSYTCIKTFQKKISVAYARFITVEHKNKRFTTTEKFMRFYVKKGETITFTKTFAIHASIGMDFKGKKGIEAKALASLKKASKKGFNGLLSEHIASWEKIWKMADIDVKPDMNIQKALRFNMYHLIISAPGDDRSSIPARTLSGEGYRGHIFWDTEIFMLPFFIHVFPEKAKNMLLYRYRTLPYARRNAREKGYKGTLYAWESADTGVDTTPDWHRDLDGKIIKIHTGKMEHHIAACVPYAVDNYYTVTGDEQFMLDAGLEILFETARFWASRVQYNKSRDTYSIKHVIGPDEFHVNVNDNAFTNYMARWNLVRATQLCRSFQAKKIRKFNNMIKRIKLREKEIAGWARISNRMPIRANRNGIVEEFSGYFKRKYFHITSYNDNLMPMIPKNLSPRHMKMTQFSKQADTVMIFTLFPDSYPAHHKRRNFVYYDIRTLHMSSLSPSMCALAGWDVGVYSKAYHYFIISLYADIENKHGNTFEGIHAAASGGNWQVVFHGFTGIRVIHDTLTFKPCLPAALKSITLKMRYKDWTLDVEVGKKKLKILPHSNKSKTLEVSVEGCMKKLKRGVKSVFELTGEIINTCGLPR